MNPNPERHRRRPSGRPQGGLRPGAVVEVEVTAVGARGDGIGRLGAESVYVPLALPGDRLRVRLEARRGDGWAAREVEALARAGRVDPACRHFGDCGGCALQHLTPPAYLAWKRQRVVEALARRGLDGVPVTEPRVAPPGSRRRARLRFDRRRGAAGGVRLGFSARASHRVVDLAGCPVLVPDIVALLPPLRRLLAELDLTRAAATGEVLVTATDGGPDVLLSAAAAANAPSLADRERLAAFAESQDLARLSWRPEAGAPPEPIASRRAARVDAGGVAVALPPGAFLQATVFGEAALREEILATLPDEGARLADLFAGCGALTLAAASRGAALAAFEADEAMVAALVGAARAAGFGDRVRGAARDLERRPLQADELRRFDAVVLDPPRAGAPAQSAALAAASPAAVPLVLMASCNPATFARDARLLVDGGYRLERVVPIDQFLWSGHVELIATFRRGGGHRPKTPEGESRLG